MMLREQFVQKLLSAMVIETAEKVESCECQSRWMLIGSRLSVTKLFSAPLFTVVLSHGSDSVNYSFHWDLDGISERGGSFINRVIYRRTIYLQELYLEERTEGPR